MRIRKDDPRSADLAVAVLRSSSVAVLPTDTIYGFSGIVPASHARIVELKGRDEGKPFIELVSSVDEAERITGPIPAAFRSYWPGPLTLILRTGAGTTAYRCPGDPWLRGIIARVGAPIYSTSVNRAGETPLSDVPSIEEAFGPSIDLIVDGGNFLEVLPSTIVDLSGEKPRLVRQGALVLDESLFQD